MVRYKYADSVLIQVTGPKSFLPEGGVTEYGRLGMTWRHFLTTICGLRLNDNSTIFICTSTYSTLNADSGWTADLNDTIKSFIEKFSRKRSKYCVRLHTGGNDTSTATKSTPTTSITASNSSTTPTPVVNGTTTALPTVNTVNNTNSCTPAHWVPNILRKPTPTTTAPVRKFATITPIKPSQLIATGLLAPPSAPANSVSNSTSTSQPAILVPQRGAPVVQPVLPQQQPQQAPAAAASPLRNATRTRPAPPPARDPLAPTPNPPRSASSIQKRAAAAQKGSEQNLPEVTFRVGQPRVIQRDANGRTIETKDTSPPKLRRIDTNQTSGAAAAADNQSSNGSPMRSPPSLTISTGSSTSQPRPATSSAPAVPTASAGPSRRPINNNNRGTRKNPGGSRFFEEDDFPRIMSVMGGALKIEPIDMNNVAPEVDSEEETFGDQHTYRTEEEIFQELGIEVDEEEDEEEEDEEDTDNASMYTADDDAERELMSSGIRVRDIAGQLDKKLERFDNSMLHRIRKEVTKLQKTDHWTRFMKRSPLACYVLGELFKDV